MTKKIVLDAETFSVPLNKLVLSPKNVRKTHAPEEIEEMAASIAVRNRGLLQNLGVTEQIDEAGEPTGAWEVVAGGRRYRALVLLAGRKRLAATAPIPCRKVAREEAMDASLVENEQRRALHPADAYEAFASLHHLGRGLGMEEIAARHGVSVHTVRQRLRLGTVAPALLAAYREGKLSLDHVMAFTVTDDRAAQERAYAELPDWQRTPAAIRRALTRSSVSAYDARVLLVGLDAYQVAGGSVQRDLFSDDQGGWVTDTVLLERLVGERMQEAAEQVRGEGWKWIVTSPQAAGEYWRLRRVWPEQVSLSEADEKRREEFGARYEELALEHSSVEDVPQEIQVELERIERELDALEARERVFRPEDMAQAGATIVLTNDGRLQVERGYVRPEDEPQPEPEDEAAEEVKAVASEHEEGDHECVAVEKDAEQAVDGARQPTSMGSSASNADPKPRPPALTADLDAELSTHRTMGLRAEIMRQPDLALRVLAHSLATVTFYGSHHSTVARLVSSHAGSYAMSAGAVADSPARQAIKQVEDEQRAKLPSSHVQLWTWLEEQEVPALLALLAVCVGRGAEAGGGDWVETAGTPHVSALAARRAGLDMRRWWTATQASYLSRVTKAGILEAVREGAGEDAARRIDGMRKDAMAENAEALLAGKGWLPQRLQVSVAGSAALELASSEVEENGGGSEGVEVSEYSIAAE